MNKNDKFYDYYLESLEDIKVHAKDFAKNNPEAATRLNINEHDIKDPHVERLLEGFSYIAAGLKEKIIDGSDFTASVLSDLICPALTKAIPATTVLHLNDINQDSNFFNLNIPKGTTFTNTYNDIDYKVQTCYDIDVSPVIVKETTLVSGTNLVKPQDTNFLKLTLKNLAGDFKDNYFKNITVFIDAPGNIRGKLYQILNCAKQDKIFSILDNDQYIYPLEKPDNIIATQASNIKNLRHKKIIEPIGLNYSETTVPNINNASFYQYLMSDYFYCSDKFFFFKLQNLESILANSSDEASIYIPINADISSISSDEFAKIKIYTNCTFAVNLYESTSQPISINHYNIENTLDSNDDENKKIYDIQEIFITSDDYPEQLKIEPYFGSKHYMHNNQIKDPKFWFARQDTQNNLKISLHGFDFTNNEEINQNLYAKALYTQPSITNIGANAKFLTSNNIAISSAVNIKPPSKFIPAETRGEKQWKSISYLNTSFNTVEEILSESSPMDLKTWLLEMVQVYNKNPNNSIFPEAELITKIKITNTIGHTGKEAWRGFVKGKRIDIFIKNKSFQQEKALIFLMIIQKILLSKLSINSFLEMSIIDDQDGHKIIDLPATCGSISLL